MNAEDQQLKRIVRLAVEAVLDKHHIDDAAKLLGVSRATLYRWRKQWADIDRTVALVSARVKGYTVDEALCALGDITQKELSRRAGYGQSTANYRMNRVLRELKLRRTPHGLALLQPSP